MKLLFFCIILLLSNSIYSQNLKANELVMQAIPLMHANKHELALEKLNNAQKEINQNYSYKEQFLIWNNIGLVYFKMLDYQEAIKQFQKAYELAKNNNKDEDVMTIINNLAVLHIKINAPDQAQQYFEEALEISKKKGDINKTAIYLVNLSSIFYEKNELNASKNLLNTFELIEPKYVDERTQINAEILKNNIYIREGKYEESIYSLEKLLSKCLTESYVDERIKILLSLAKSKRQLQQYDKSNDYLKKSLQLTNDPSYLIDIYTILSQNALDQYSFKEALNYKDSIFFFKQELQSRINLQNTENAQLKFKLTKATLEKNAEKDLYDQSRKHYLIVIALCILIFCLLIFSIYKKNQYTKQREQLIEKNLRIKELELKQVESLKDQLKIQLEQYLNESEEVKKEIATLEKKYIETSTYNNKIILDISIYQQTTKEILKELLNEILLIKEQASTNELYTIIQKLKNHLMLEDNFDNHIDQDFYTISEKIKQKHPSLTTNDLRLLNLLHLNTTTKEIAKILYISPEGVRKRKERLKTKLGLEKNDNLIQYIQDLNKNHP